MLLRTAKVDDASRPRPERRRLQSEAARRLALELLQGQGVFADTIPRGGEGQPIWPPGWTGSLAHTEGRAAAAVALLTEYASLGIDIEPDAPLPGETETLILRPEERGGGREVFCAKECVHKAIQPLTGAWLEFEEVRIEWDAERARFRPVAVSNQAVVAFGDRVMEGRLHRENGFLVAILTVSSIGAAAIGSSPF